MNENEFLTDIMREAYLPFAEDRELLAELGLEDTDEEWVKNARGQHFLGRVKLENGGERPDSEVYVFAMTAPATFWTFVIKRPRSAFHYEPCPDNEGGTGTNSVTCGLDCPKCEGLGKVQILDSEPWEVMTLGSGSGSLTEFWPAARALATRMLDLEWVSGPHPDMSQDHFAGMESEVEADSKNRAWARKVAGVPDQEDS